MVGSKFVQGTEKVNEFNAPRRALSVPETMTKTLNSALDEMEIFSVRPCSTFQSTHFPCYVLTNVLTLRNDGESGRLVQGCPPNDFDSSISDNVECNMSLALC